MFDFPVGLNKWKVVLFQQIRSSVIVHNDESLWTSRLIGFKSCLKRLRRERVHLKMKNSLLNRAGLEGASEDRPPVQELQNPAGKSSLKTNKQEIGKFQESDVRRPRVIEHKRAPPSSSSPFTCSRPRSLRLFAQSTCAQVGTLFADLDVTCPRSVTTSSRGGSLQRLLTLYSRGAAATSCSSRGAGGWQEFGKH